MNRILLVEDDPFWQAVLRHNIRSVSKNSEVDCVRSGAEAKNLLDDDDQDFGLIIADQFLDGDMTGYDLWDHCQKTGNDVPFLLTSGNSDFCGELLQNIHFVPKAFISAEIRDRLHKMLGGENRAQYFAEAADVWSAPPDKVVLAIAILIGLIMLLVATRAAAPPTLHWPPTHTPELLAPPPSIDLYENFLRGTV